MNQAQVDLFGRELGPDPRIALPSLPPRAIGDGPLSRVQFVVEMVGQYATRAGSVNQLLEPQWHSALGQPNIFVLKQGSPDWTRLVPTKDDLYDSVCLAWNYFTPGGQLSTQSVAHLLRVAESYANQIGRYAVALTPIQNVDAIVAALLQVSNDLDAGFAVAVVPRSGSVPEKSLWIICSNLGLEYSGTGTFEWRVPQHPEPVLTVSPIGATETFSLAAVQNGVVHQGVSISFRLVTCPAASVAVDAVFRIADVMCQAIGGVAYDDTDRLLNESVKAEIKSTTETVSGILSQAGLAPGSPEALLLFS